jgi:methionine sulfoxide reductase heme-binding subunit
MNEIARIVASKWFAGPLCVAPLFFLSWNYFQALSQLEQKSSSSIQRVSDANLTSVDTTVTDTEFADFSFTVSDEDFHEFTGGTFKQIEEESTENEDMEDNFSFTVSDEQFDSATETLSLQEGGDQDAFIARKMTESANQVKAGANVNERFLHETGNVTIAYFLIVLCFTPLKRIFSRAKLVSALNRHRRLVGLTAFFYAVLHLILYFDDGLNRLFDEWYLFYIQCGLASFVTLSVLAMTSNGRAIRKLGGKRWKKLHRILYLAIPALLYHKGWAGKASPDQVREALVWFAPMLLLQAVRLTKFFTTKKVN